MSSAEFERAVVEGLQKGERALTKIEEHEKHCSERYEGILNSVETINDKFDTFTTFALATMITIIGFLIHQVFFA